MHKSGGSVPWTVRRTLATMTQRTTDRPVAVQHNDHGRHVTGARHMRSTESLRLPAAAPARDASGDDRSRLTVFITVASIPTRHRQTASGWSRDSSEGHGQPSYRSEEVARMFSIECCNTQGTFARQ